MNDRPLLELEAWLDQLVSRVEGDGTLDALIPIMSTNWNVCLTSDCPEFTLDGLCPVCDSVWLVVASATGTEWSPVREIVIDLELTEIDPGSTVSMSALDYPYSAVERDWFRAPLVVGGAS